MIDRLNATLDVRSHLRVEISVRERARSRPDRTEKNVTPQGPGPDTEARRRAALPSPETENNIIQFQQTSVADDAADTATEVQPALEASVLPYDPRLAAVARLYQRDGRSALRSDRVGTRLNAVA